MSTRLLNAALGVWLFLSAFLWPQTAPQMTNAWVTGTAVVVVALVAVAVPRVRYVNALAGLWLVVSGPMLPGLLAVTTWNQVLVGVAVTTLALLPPRVRKGQVRSHAVW